MRTWRQLLCVMPVAFLAVAQTVRADGLSVYVGYIDSLRPNPAIPSPFCLGFGPTCQVEQNPPWLDAGAFRIDNTGSSPVTITDIKVTLNSGSGPVVFAIWDSVTISPGGMAIFSQTETTNGGSFDNFDSSDYPLFASNPGGSSINGIGGCSTLSVLTAAQRATCVANFPVISFDENGNAVTITDSGSILNYGGWDPGIAGGNESLNWSLAGTVQSTPEPTSLFLLGVGALAGLGGRRWLRCRAN